MRIIRIFDNSVKFITSINPNIRFFFFLFLFAVIYTYPSVFLKRPQSVHHWRQSDCASLALNYYQDGMRFFQPQTHNLTSLGATSSYSAPSEIPIAYYSVAILYKIFGYHDYIFRLFNTMIFFLGLFYLFKSCLLLFKDFFWAAATSLLFFTSPVLVFYGNNFLSDTPAFAFALIAWYFFIRFYQDKQPKDIYISMLFFLLAGANKISALISLVAITALFSAELLRLFKLKSEAKVFSKPFQFVLPVLIVFGIIASWVFYAKGFNLEHNSVYFSTRIIPIWDLDSSQIQAVISNVKGLWLNQYFHRYTLIFIAAALLFSIVFAKKANRFVFLTTLVLLVGVIIYAVLWFPTFKDHDYYTINLYILLVFILINFVIVLKNRFPKAFNSLILKLIFGGFLLFNVNHARLEMYGRYNGWWTEYPEYKDYHEISPYLRSIGIQPMDTVVCLPDMTHFTLYLMNQRGWTGCLGYNSDSAGIAQSISKGADYLILHGEETLNREYLQSFLKYQIGEFNSVKIYNLNPK